MTNPKRSADVERMKHIRLYIFLYFTAGWLLDVVYRCLDRVTRNEQPQWAERSVEQATGYYLAMALLPWVFFMTRRFPISAFKSIPAHLGGVVCYSLAHTSSMWVSRLILFPLFGLGPYDYGVMPTRYFMEFPSDLINYFVWAGAYTVYHNWLRTKNLEKELVAARLSALTHRLQPHFLFNALNALSAAIYEDPHRADRMLERICDFLRATLRVPESPLVPLSMEFGLARQYLEVMKARLEDRLQFEIECGAGEESAQVPALLLQPLVENAIEHGQDPISGHVDVRIEASRRNGFVTISVRDRGRGFSPNGPGSNGHGLANVRQRLKTVYGDQASLDVRHEAGGAQVDVRIPV
jgi:two-component system, LytTR family, sensor kinase